MIDTSVVLDDSFVPFLPPKLTKVCMGHSVAVDQEWSRLPSSLLWLGDGPVLNPPVAPNISSSQNQNFDLSLLPPRITRVDLSNTELTPEALLLLPRTVTRLKLRRLDDEMSPKLPPFLTYLCLSRDDCTTSGVEKWPRSIHTLLLNNVALIDPLSIAKLPKLKFLSLMRLEPLSWQPSLFKHLPITLESIKIHACPQLASNAFIEALKQLSKLEILEISEENGGDSKISSACFQHLPNSLKTLELALANEPIPANTLPALPRGLRSLKLHSRSGLSWAPIDFSSLPRWLVALELPSFDTLIGKEALQFFPSTLETFSTGQSTPFWWSMRSSRS
jgi:hypothetical protein